jgi:hypothetical protein
MKAELIQEVADKINLEVYIDLCDRLTKIDKYQLEDELKRQSSIYAYYSGAMIIAKQRMDQLEIQIEQKSASVRLAAVDSSDKKITDKNLEAIVTADPDISSLKQDYNNLTTRYSLLKSLVTALDHKKDMLIQLSSNQRAETKLYNN